MDRLTEYHGEKAVIKDKSLLPQAIEKLAEYFEAKIEQMPVGRKRSHEVNTMADVLSIIYELQDDESVAGSTWHSIDELPKGTDSERYYACLLENCLYDPPIICQYDKDYGFGCVTEVFDHVTLGFKDTEFSTIEELGWEKVLLWTPLPSTF